MRKHKAFRVFALKLLNHKLLLTGVVVAAFVSATGLGVGLLAMVPVLKMLLTPGASLTSIIQAEALERGITLPSAWLNLLPSSPFQSIVLLMSIIVLLTFVGAAANFFHRYLSLTLTAITIADIRQDIFNKTIRLPLSRLHNNIAEAQSRLINDTDMLRLGFGELTSKFIAQIFKSVAAFGAALIIDWRITLWALLVLPPLAILLKKLGKRVRRASDRLLRARSGLLGLSGETYTGLRAIKSSNAEHQREESFKEINLEALRQEMKARTALALAPPLTEALMVIVLATLATFAARFIIAGNLQPDKFLLALAALAAAGGSLKPVSSLWQSLQMSDSAARRILDLTLSTPESQNLEASPILQPQSSIRFNNISFTYKGNTIPAISDFSLTIHVGTTVAFVGPNGSGKTTLLSLLPRFFEPDAGTITLDDQDIAHANLKSLRAQIGVVSQDVLLFSGSILENITLGAPDASQDQIQHAIDAAHAEDLITLKGGLDAQVGEGGVSLSGGQRQRLSIARALLGDPSILILDEATSMIDADSESRIAQAVREFSKDRTCLIIAHRLSTVQHADLIVVIDKGRISASGTHSQLLDSSDLYQRLVAGQLVSINS